MSMCFEGTWDAEMRLGWGLCFLSLFSKNKPLHLLLCPPVPSQQRLAASGEWDSACWWSQLPRRGGWALWDQLPKSVMTVWLPIWTKAESERKQHVLPPWGQGTIWKEGMRSKTNRKRKKEEWPDGRATHPMARFPSKHSSSGFDCWTWEPALGPGRVREKQK